MSNSDVELSIERAPSACPSPSRSPSVRPGARSAPFKARSKSRSTSAAPVDVESESKREEAPTPVEPVATTSASSRPKVKSKSKSSSVKEVDDKPAKAKPVKSAPSHKRRKDTTGGPVKKRPRVILSDDESDEEEAPAPAQSGGKSHAQAAESSEKENEHHSGGAGKQRSGNADSKKPVGKKRRTKDEKDDDDNGASTITKKASSSALTRKVTSSHSKGAATLDKPPVPTRELDLSTLPLPLQEMQGMLIETLATSRASSMPPSSLYTALMSSRPALKEYQSTRHEGLMEKKEWMGVIEDVLEAGWSSSGVFGKVESTIKDAADHQLESQWFYVPEKDEDEERASLIRSMMPRPGKRSETKKSKQYYWRPLGKISRWDPEDDL
ncbi:hypothetical protein DAEQUDRAFT_676979 [Daedalea quercina L-15889]|uniref:Uncharacterized protein n=1 Tax=Daedalea quercina L-15889 TaxID=1314783 RepID=A0A165M8Z1_9APHY|nr:hypothetical protein DAEQUDRAFT_676979 [Daedalea quercina L-15889]